MLCKLRDFAISLNFCESNALITQCSVLFDGLLL